MKSGAQASTIMSSEDDTSFDANFAQRVGVQLCAVMFISLQAI